MSNKRLRLDPPDVFSHWSISWILFRGNVPQRFCSDQLSTLSCPQKHLVLLRRGLDPVQDACGICPVGRFISAGSWQTVKPVKSCGELEALSGASQETAGRRCPLELQRCFYVAAWWAAAVGAHAPTLAQQEGNSPWWVHEEPATRPWHVWLACDACWRQWWPSKEKKIK